MFWVRRGSELCLGGGEAQELPTDINAANGISVFLGSTYVVLQGLTENIFLPCKLPLHAGGPALAWCSAAQGRLPKPTCGGCRGCEEHTEEFLPRS